MHCSDRSDWRPKPKVLRPFLHDGPVLYLLAGRESGVTFYATVQLRESPSARSILRAGQRSCSYLHILDSHLLIYFFVCVGIMSIKLQHRVGHPSRVSLSQPCLIQFLVHPPDTDPRSAGKTLIDCYVRMALILTPTVFEAIPEGQLL